MNVKPATSVAARVVILAVRADRAAALQARCTAAQGGVCVTDDPYDAAAELLITPRAALVVDLSTTGPRRTGLIALAGRRGVPVVIVGRPSHGERIVGGLTAVAEDNLLQAVARAISADPVQPPPDAAAERPVPPQTSPQGPQQVAAPAPGRPCPPSLESTDPSQVLTPGEISALLKPP